MRIKKLIAASAAAVMLASNQTAMTGVSYAAEAVAESQIVYGEVNGDGKVSLSDAVAILQYIANRDKYPLSAKAVLNADCVDHGDGVTGMDALALKLIDANMLKAEDLPVTSQKIQECLNPHTSEEALLFDEVYTFGVYNAETKTIDIEWLVNETVKEVEIFVSDDNQKYVSVAKVKDEAKYSYEVKEDFDTKFFKVSYTDKEGKIHESFPFFITKKDDKYATEFFDTDEDGVVDMYESAFGCKVDETDTDKDGLSDYEEINITKTNPAIRDSFKKDVSDADADCDEDGISNITELKNGTNPIRKDTDYDGLTDLEEINELKTNPLLRDTDEDGLTDYAERKMGLDPLKPETNGVADAEVVIDQKIDSEAAVLKSINEDESNEAYKLSVDIKTAGFAEDVVSVSKSRYSVVINEKSIVGDIVDIVADDTKLESMRLNFSICDEFKDNTLGTYEGLEGIKRFTVFQYNEDIHMLIPMDTEYSEMEGIVSAEIEGTGTYCILDSECWFDSLGIKPEEDIPEAPDTESVIMSSVADVNIGATSSSEKNEPFEVIFTIQAFGKGGEEAFLLQKSMILELSRYLFRNYDNVVIHVVPYGKSSEERYILKPDYITDNVPDLTYDFTNMAELDRVANRIEYFERSNRLEYSARNAAYHFAKREVGDLYNFDHKNFIINLMNSETIFEVAQPSIGNEPSWAQDLFSYGNKFIEVYVGNPPDEELSKFIKKMNGLDLEFNPTRNFEEILDYIADKIDTYNGYKAPTRSCIISDILRGELTPDSEIDSDGDGVSDWDELDKKYVNVNSDGTFSLMTHTDIFKKANVNVGKKKEGNKVLQWDDTPYGPQLEKYYNERTVAIWWSHPLLKDSDFDQIPDLLDNAPFNHIDDHFKVVDDYSEVTYRQLLCNGFESTLKNAEESAPKYGIGLGVVNPVNAFVHDSLVAGVVFGYSPFSSDFFRLSDINSKDDFVDAFGSLPNASAALAHYITKINPGSDFKFEKYPYAIAYTCVGRNRYYKNMNAYFDMVEKNAKVGNTYEFSTVKNLDRPQEILGEKVYAQEAWKEDYSNIYGSNMNANCDWWFAVQNCQTALSSSVYCHLNEYGDTVYTAKIRYYLLDVYDWSTDDFFENLLYNLHTAGLAKAFLDYGVYETEIEWIKGSRFPKEKITHEVCQQLLFDGISDSNLRNNYNEAQMYYALH